MPLCLEKLDLKAGKPLYMSIADHIEGLIESRTLRHNEKLPSTAALAKSMDVTISTAQQALGRLVEKGLLKRSPKLGTFVNAAKDSRCVAVTFGFHPFAMETKFYAIFLKGLEREFAARDMKYVCHYGLIHEGLEPGLRRLKAELEEGRYSCILAIAHSLEFYDWLKRQEYVPAFDIAPPDSRAAAREGMAHLLDRGYENPLFVSMSSKYNMATWDEEREGLRQAFEERGLRFDESSMRLWGISMHDAYISAKDALAKGVNGRLPDALFINHDLMTKGALLALSEMGLKIPKDMALVSHVNTGDPLPVSMPISRIETDPLRFAKATVEHIAGLLPSCPRAGLQERAQPAPFDFIEGDSTPPNRRRRQ